MKAIFFGDLCVTKSNVNAFIAGKGNTIFSNRLMDVIRSYDFLSINLESPLIKDYSKPIKKCGPTLGANSQSINGINYLKPSLVCIANNHIYDYGYDGLKTTIEALKNNNINYIGNIDAEINNNIFIDDDIGVINFCENEFSFNYKDDAGACCLSSSIYPQIVKLKKQANKVVVIFHGGTENFDYPSPSMVTTCRSFVDLGADLVLCQHSHCIGCYEKYHGGTIVYGQGNFLFDEYSKDDKWVYGIGVIFDTKTNDVGFIVSNFKNGIVDISSQNDSMVLEEFEKRSIELQNGEYIKKYQKFCDCRYTKFLCKLRGYSKVRTGIEVLLFKGFFVKRAYHNKKIFALYDVLNCEAHQELIKTSMSNYVFKKTKDN